MTSAFANTTPANAGKAGYDDGFASPFNARTEDNPALQQYNSWGEFYGPVSAHDDTFTNLVRYNLSDPYTTPQGVAGYGALAGIVPRQTFASDNIVIIQDGLCASTCAIFTEFMKEQGNVGQVVFGGRAQTGPMQGVGGTKGANEYGFDLLLQDFQLAYNLSSASQQVAWDQQWGQAIAGIVQAVTRATQSSEGANAHVNFRNNIRKGDETLTPLQFVYEAANCRLFYTAAQIENQALVWKAAYNSYWNGAPCVSGSTGQLSSKPGVGYILASPGAKSAPSTPTSAIVAATGTSTTSSHGGAAALPTAAFAAVMPVLAAGALLL